MGGGWAAGVGVLLGKGGAGVGGRGGVVEDARVSVAVAVVAGAYGVGWVVRALMASRAEAAAASVVMRARGHMR